MEESNENIKHNFTHQTDLSCTGLTLWTLSFSMLSITLLFYRGSFSFHYHFYFWFHVPV